jgi:hypothetical protein
VDKVASNPRDLAIALKLSDLDMSKAGREIKGNTTLGVLGWYWVSFLLLISLSSRIRVITAGTSQIMVNLYINYDIQTIENVPLI